MATQNKILSFGAIIEARFPNKMLDKYKRENNKVLFIRNMVSDFFSNGLKTIGKYDVYYTNQNVGYEEKNLCEINDFDYCESNQVKKNKDKKTFRFFGGQIMTIFPCMEIANEDKFINIDKTPKPIMYKGVEFIVYTTNFSEHLKRN